MKVLPFTIPVPHDHSIIVQREVLPHFYPHLHRHAEVQITWIQEGDGTLLAGNGMHSFNAGEIYVLGANQPHLFKSSPGYFAERSDQQVRSVTIFFDPKAKLAPLFNLPEMKAVKAYSAEWHDGFKVPNKLYSQFAAQILAVANAAGAAQLSLFIQMLNDIASTEMEPLGTERYTTTMSDPEGMRIAAVYNYIMHNYSGPLTLDEVARQAHLTPNAFCRYFKKHTRHTFVAFVNKVRVNEACKMLINGTHGTIAEVAYNCGFSSITNFNYVFKGVTGKSPKEYLSDYTGAVRNAGG